jgi:hypothetical protein
MLVHTHDSNLEKVAKASARPPLQRIFAARDSLARRQKIRIRKFLEKGRQRRDPAAVPESPCPAFPAGRRKDDVIVIESGVASTAVAYRVRVFC